MKRFTYRFLALLMGMMLTASGLFLSTPVYGTTEIPQNLDVIVDGGESTCVKAIQLAYENNYYVSMRDMAALLAGTEKQFSLSTAEDTISIQIGEAYSATGKENLGWAQSGQAAGGHNLSYHGITVNGAEKRYYSMIVSAEDAASDAYLSILDAAMILDIRVTADSSDGFYVDTTGHFQADPVKLEENGYFQAINCVLVGNTTTGEIYYGYQADQAFPIASTTKLMTYLLVQDALAAGQISMDDNPVISEKAQLLSQNDDRVIPLTAGKTATMPDLLKALLLCSSNECALVLAEHVAGSEEAFVERMNEKAQELGMETALYYNCNGLPSFANAATPAKRSNHMSAEDMFRLCSHILNTYPQITEITSIKSADLYSLETEAKNTNGVLYNMPEVNGLKTGTTIKAGACLVTSLRVEEQDIVVVMLGSETSQDRVRFCEMLSRYGKNVVLGIEESTGYGAEEPKKEQQEGPAKDAKGIIRQVVRRMRENEKNQQPTVVE